VGRRQIRAVLLKQDDRGPYALLLIFGQRIPRIAKLIGVFDVPAHD
jgi:hypothetical protein